MSLNRENEKQNDCVRFRTGKEDRKSQLCADSESRMFVYGNCDVNVNNAISKD